MTEDQIKVLELSISDPLKDKIEFDKYLNSQLYESTKIPLSLFSEVERRSIIRKSNKDKIFDLRGNDVILKLVFKL
jgi:hypothetical protein